MKNNTIDDLRQAYLDTPIPDELEWSVRNGLSDARKQQQQKRLRIQLQRTIGVAASLLLLLTLTLNTSPAFASALSEVPVVRHVVRVLTLREYHFEENGYHAALSAPEIEGLNNKDLELALNDKYATELKTLYMEFVEGMKEIEENGGGHLGVTSGYEVKTDTERLLTIGRYVEIIVGSSSTVYRYDNIDKIEETFITLPSLFTGDDYVHVISESIKSQMIAAHEADPDMIYWVEGIGEEPSMQLFETIDPNQNFYLTEDHQLVISFDKYEVAPGYMGMIEFTIPSELLQNLLVSDVYVR
ncbi:RsiV family protein [Anoxynatronum sibiricum]|uniref:RsiV family protein n=1 Tax=Anoxynatronum sibiricum TaxID=210623 RepID=A0ABU9VY01_9CLOT